MVVGHPAQEADGERDLVGVDALRRGALELGGQHEALAAHLRPVLDGLPDVLEHLAHRALELGAALLVALAVDRQQHPRLGELADGDLGLLAGRRRGRRRCSSLPTASRLTTSCGWTMRWMSMPALTRAPVTESTRKGMSSVTIWMMVRALDQPSTSVLGL